MPETYQAVERERDFLRGENAYLRRQLAESKAQRPLVVRLEKVREAMRRVTEAVHTHAYEAHCAGASRVADAWWEYVEELEAALAPKGEQSEMQSPK